MKRRTPYEQGTSDQDAALSDESQEQVRAQTSAAVHPIHAKEKKDALLQSVQKSELFRACTSKRRRSTISEFVTKSDEMVLLTLENAVGGRWDGQDQYELLRDELGLLVWVVDLSGIYWPSPAQAKSPLKRAARVIYSSTAFLYTNFYFAEIMWALLAQGNSFGLISNSFFWAIYLAAFFQSSKLLRKSPTLVLLLTYADSKSKGSLKRRIRKAVGITIFLALVLYVLGMLGGDRDYSILPIALRRAFGPMVAFWMTGSDMCLVILCDIFLLLYQKRISRFVELLNGSAGGRFSDAKGVIEEFQLQEAFLRLVCETIQFPFTFGLSIAGALCLSTILRSINNILDKDENTESADQKVYILVALFLFVNVSVTIVILLLLHRGSSITTNMQRLAQLINIYGFKHLPREDHIHATHYVEMAMQNNGVSFKLYGLAITGSLTFKVGYILIYAYCAILFQMLK